MKKIFYVSMVVLLVAALFLLPGCAQEAEAPEEEEEEELNGEDIAAGEDTGEEAGEETEEPSAEEEGAAESAAWEIAIVGPSGDEMVITLDELKEMEAVELEAESKGEKNTFKGVVLNLVLAEAGISEASEVTLIAADGYSAAISGEVALSDNTILAYEVNGVDLSGDEKNGPIRLVTTEDTPKAWVGKLSKIEVK